jgi:hypothetical protein
MVTMAQNKKLKALELKLADARHELEHLEREQMVVEIKVCKIKAAITEILSEWATEALPTGLYNKGYKLQEKEHNFILSNQFGEEVCLFKYVPSLGDLMDAERQYI